MISQETFDRLELKHGCGYWNLCVERTCPCAISVENKGLQESIYDSLSEEARQVAKQSNIEDIDEDDYEDDEYEGEDNGEFVWHAETVDDTPSWGVCEKCGEEISIVTASRYGDKCQDCYVGVK